MPRKLLVLLAFVPIILGAVTFWHSSRDAGAQTTTTVNVGNFYFCSAASQGGICDTNITAGDTVMWQWVGGSSHTVTQCDPSFTTCPTVGGFDSGSMTSGTFSQTFNIAGAFEYRCNIHPTLMRGRVNVAAQQATPTATAGPTASTSTTPTPAQTSAPGQTISPTPVRTAQPATVPQTGGPPDSGGKPWTILLAALGVAVIIGSGVLAVRVRRR
jgi:hypothetical protein